MSTVYDDGREARLREAVAAGDDGARRDLGIFLTEVPGREAEAEAVLREALDTGERDIEGCLGWLLGRQKGREAEAERAYRRAIADGDDDARINLGWLLASQPGREPDAENLYRDAGEAGDPSGWTGLAALLWRRGRNLEAELACRAAIDGGDGDAYVVLGGLLAGDRARAKEAEAALRAALAFGGGEHVPRDAATALGRLLAREGDVEGAQAAFELAIAIGMDGELGEVGVARCARVAIAVVRRPRVARLAGLVMRPLARLCERRGWAAPA